MITLNESSQARWQAENCEHLRYEYDLSPADVVIDIGAHKGEFSQAIFDRYQCQVIAVEPTGYIEGFTDGEIIQQAAADYDGEQSFGGLSLYTSIYEPVAHSYPCFDVCTLLEKYPDIGLVKINIEGGEYRLLKHILARGMQQRIRNLQVQFHQIEGQPYERWYEEIVVELNRTHSLTFCFPYCWENWKRDEV